MRCFSKLARSRASVALTVAPAVVVTAVVTVVLASGFVVGCSGVESVRCAGGAEAGAEDWYCPSGMLCHDTRRCVYPGDVEACEDLYDGAICSSPRTADGVCVDGVCIVILNCGDGVVDVGLGEVCDDGNRLSGDGCSHDCRSDETCGNGYLDVGMGERCDVSNLGGESCESLGYLGGGTLGCDVFCRYDQADCQSICGNAQVEPDEACDGFDLADETCESLGLGGGFLACRPDCRHHDVSGCDIEAECGNGTIEYPEPCDGINVGGMTCELQGQYPGVMGCNPDCTQFDVSGCGGVCGDGQLNGPEACDATDFGSDSCQARGYYTGSLECLANCASIDQWGCSGECGDGQINGPEVCDSQDFGTDSCEVRGFYTGSLVCDSTCSSIDGSSCLGSCGDGICEPGHGETHGSCVVDCLGFSAISVGGAQTCAVGVDGTAWCWGRNHIGQLGNGSTSDSFVPVQVTGLTNVVAISVGAHHCCAVVSGGTAWCWGEGELGRLGNGSTSDSTIPVQVTGLTNAVSITAGYSHSCAVASNGTAWCWGAGADGRLGNGDTVDSEVPVQVTGLTNAEGISAGSAHSCAVASNGTAWCWGSGGDGRLGNGDTVDASAMVPVSGLSDVVDISAGSAHSCAVASGGTAWCWGRGDDGQLGTMSGASTDEPVQVVQWGGLQIAVDLSAGFSHTCAVASDSVVWCWGYGGDGCLGNGSSSDSMWPVRVQGPIPSASQGMVLVAEAISAGYSHSCAVVIDGTAWCWGQNWSGQLGNGTQSSSNVPVQVTAPSIP